MRVLMLGWEFPPHISGGLGTACEGLTTGLTRHGIETIFVVPYLLGGESAAHMVLVDSLGNLADGDGESSLQGDRARNAWLSQSAISRGKLDTRRVASALSPYLTPESFQNFVASLKNRPRLTTEEQLRREAELLDEDERRSRGKEFFQYGRDIFEEVSRFASRVTELFRDESFDLIHVHDWMTFPAGAALAEITGRPLVAHVHSLEYDRSGAFGNPQILEIERLGLSAARTVIAVSYYTRKIINEQYDIPLEKITVVHNGVYSPQAVASYREHTQWPSKVVLFLGRITFQKGPDYFVEAAAKVVPHIPEAFFVMAGSGDMRQRMINRVAELGIDRHFYFPGFLRGQEVEEMFSLADLYVMPSVSEPFGIAALEAIKFDTPVVLSRQSGVAEVLHHALKCDFWDVDRMAELMINALSYPELREDMVAMAREEVRRLHWEASALKTIDVYRKLV